MNIHVSTISAYPAAAVLGAAVARQADPMVAHVQRWKRVRSSFSDAWEATGDAAAEDNWIRQEADALRSVFASTATSNAGFEALLEVVARTAGEVDESEMLAAIQRSFQGMGFLS